MASYEVTVDGTRYEVDAANADQAWQYANVQHAQRAQPQTTAQTDRAAADKAWEKLSGFEQFGVGIAKPLMNVYHGIKEATVGLTPDEQLQARALEQTKGLPAVAGEVATLAVPGTAVARGANLVRQGLPRALATLTGEAALGAGYGAAAPTLDEGPTRPERALTGAAGGALGAAGGMALNRLLTGAYGPVSDAARNIIDRMRAQGIEPRLTPGQMSGGWANSVENMVQNLPGNRALAEQRRDAIGDWNQMLMRESAPAAVAKRITQPGVEGFRQLDDAVSEMYRRGMANVEIAPTDANLDRLTGITHNIRETGARERFDGAIDEIWREVEGGRLNADTIKNLESTLRETARRSAHSGDIASARAYRELRDTVRTMRDEAAGPEQAAILGQADAAYGDVMDFAGALELAGAQRAGVFTPNQLQRGVNVGQSRKQKARARGQGEAESGREVFGDRLPEVGPGTAEKLIAAGGVGGGVFLDPSIAAAAALPLTIGQLRRNPRFMTGDLPVQEFLRNAPVIPGLGAAAGMQE